jgi:hypothetical protein
MRLLIVTSLHPDFDARVWRHARTAVKLGYQVELICPWSIESGEIFEGVEFNTFIPTTNRLSRLWQIPSRVVTRVLRSCDKATIIHFHDIDLLPWMAVVSMFKNVVYDVHENYPDEMLVRAWLPESVPLTV